MTVAELIDYLAVYPSDLQVRYAEYIGMLGPDGGKHFVKHSKINKVHGLMRDAQEPNVWVESKKPYDALLVFID